MGIISKTIVGLTISAFASTLISTEALSKEGLYYELSKQLINKKQKVSGKNVSSLYFAVISKNEQGKYFLNDELEISEADSCYFKRVSKQKIDFYSKLTHQKDMAFPQTHAEIKDYLFNTARVDTFLFVESDNKASVHLWGAEKEAYILETKEDEDNAEPSKALGEYCRNMGYNGVVVDVTKDQITIISHVKNIDSKKQASVMGSASGASIIADKTKFAATAILEYTKHSDERLIFKKKLGKVNAWDKVYIPEPEPAKKPE